MEDTLLKLNDDVWYHICHYINDFDLVSGLNTCHFLHDKINNIIDMIIRRKIYYCGENHDVFIDAINASDHFLVKKFLQNNEFNPETDNQYSLRLALRNQSPSLTKLLLTHPKIDPTQNNVIEYRTDGLYFKCEGKTTLSFDNPLTKIILSHPNITQEFFNNFYGWKLHYLSEDLICWLFTNRRDLFQGYIGGYLIYQVIAKPKALRLVPGMLS
jgi:hypothetical protein